MKIVSMTGSGSGCGKTAAACALLRAFPGLGALKLSPRDEKARLELGPGRKAGKDTGRFHAGGARSVARIVGRRDEMAGLHADVMAAMAGCTAIIVEGGALSWSDGPRLTVFVVGGGGALERRERFRDMAINSDIILMNCPTLRGNMSSCRDVISHLGCDEKVCEVGGDEEAVLNWIPFTTRVAVFLGSV